MRSFARRGFQIVSVVLLGWWPATALDPPPALSVWTTSGEDVRDYLGQTVASAGDVNGDGYGDVIVGAYGNDHSTGKAYLFLGGPGGPSGIADWTARGDGWGVCFGWTVASAGDVNGDGYADVLVYATDGSQGRGRVFLYQGGPHGLGGFPTWTATGTAPFTEYDEFGDSLSTAGDVNGDGYADVIIGEPGINQWAGQAHLYLGGPAGLSTAAVWTASGEEKYDHFGSSVAAAGDVNGDGYADVIVGAGQYPGARDFGKAYLYLGGPGGLAATPAWTATGGGNIGDGLGASVATAGDVNGDGFADVIVGSPGYNEVRGRASLFLGGPAGLSASAAWSADGEWASAHFGESVAPAGDVNDDGYADVIIGAHGNPQAGRAYVYLGGPGGLSGVPAWTADGELVGDYYGTAVSGAGDVNGDGYSDVMVGAYYADWYPGKAYVYPMGPCAPPVEEISISMVRLDANRRPVLTWADPARSPTVTGYNVYRAASSRGPWTRIGVNVNDPYTDPTGDTGGPWFYRVAAWNDACSAEGPR